MIKTRTWIIIIAAILIISVILCVWLSGRRAEGTVANVYQDGVCIKSIDLSLVKSGYEFTVSDDKGENTVRVENGRICVLYADCPDQVCVNAGWLSDSASPIVCLPHRLVIRIGECAESENTSPGIDAVSQ